MTIVQQACPSCSAPLQIPAGVRRITCPYCGAALAVTRTDGELTLETADRITGALAQTSAQTQAAIQTGAFVTQAELRRLQVTQDLSMAQMRLSNVQSEIRTIERVPPTGTTRRQLRDLRSQEAALRQQIASLQALLNPPDARQAAPVAPTTQGGWDKEIFPALFSFSGRAPRSTYWLGMIVCFVLALIVSATAGDPESPSGPGFIGTVATLLLLWIGLAVSIKRYRDRGKAAWWVFIILIPVIGLFWQFFELAFMPGTTDPNQDW